MNSPPAPPRLAAGDIAALIAFAQAQITWFERYLHEESEHGIEPSPDELAQLEGWKFTAQALADAWA
ncbi:MAG: hypothetical protein JWO63_526 [Frankiales bacterium]|nr:hypothetical protein [Frankiales bacterium]